MGSTHSSEMNNNGNDASASGNGDGDDDAIMAAVVNQPAAEDDQQQQSHDPNAAGYVNAANLTDRQFERLLQEYEEKGERQRLQKKQRLERGYADVDYPYVAPPEGCPPFSSLPREAIQLVFEFLPGVRSVFNLAYQSKYMLSFVEKRVSRGINNEGCCTM